MVSLTYKKSGKFETSAGGIATIVTFFFLLYWVIINLFYSIYDNGSFNTSMSTTVTQQADGEYPVYEFDGNDMFLAYRLGSFREDIDIDQYVQGVWI